MFSLSVRLFPGIPVLPTVKRTLQYPRVWLWVWIVVCGDWWRGMGLILKPLVQDNGWWKSMKGWVDGKILCYLSQTPQKVCFVGATKFEKGQKLLISVVTWGHYNERWIKSLRSLVGNGMEMMRKGIGGLRRRWERPGTPWKACFRFDRDCVTLSLAIRTRCRPVLALSKWLWAEGEGLKGRGLWKKRYTVEGWQKEWGVERTAEAIRNACWVLKTEQEERIKIKSEQ